MSNKPAVIRKKQSAGSIAFKIVAYTVCILLAALSIFPFIVMIVNSTRDTFSIQSSAISFIPGTNLSKNLHILTSKDMFNPWRGLENSLIIAACATALTVYFSTLTAYGLIAYDWKLRGAFFTMILCVMMIPATVTSIGFY